MNIVGGDAAAIREFARRLAARTEQIQEAQRRMTAVIDGVPWAGDDRERFLSEWRTVHEPNIARMVLDLGNVVGDAHRAADAQDRASGA
jgi:uncharacterized protein YukE